MMTALTAPPLIISTDLDGTLLDHYDYSWSAARPALDRLASLAIPIILNTSKTCAEVLALQKNLGLHYPFIVENGSALFLPADDYDWLIEDLADKPAVKSGNHFQIEFGTERTNIIDFIHRLRNDFCWDFEGFSDWNIQQIMESTGLDEKSASRAAEKMFSEPVTWNDSQANLDTFIEHLATRNLRLLKGGRFYHVQGQTDKGRPLLWLKNLYASKTGSAPQLVSLGDSENDVEMLKVADYPVCVRSPVTEYPAVDTDKTVIKTDSYGPAGWNEAINDILSAISQ